MQITTRRLLTLATVGLMGFVLAPEPCRAQIVDTFHLGLSAFDGMAVDSEGNLLAAQYTSPGTGSLYKVTPAGIASELLTGLRGGAGVDIGPDGFIYVAEYNSNTVLKVSPDGVAEIFASGLSGPIGLDFDGAGNLYIQNYNTSVVHRVTPAGAKVVFATVTGLTQGSALAIDDDDNIYLTGYRTNQVFRVTPDGTSSVFAMGGSAGYGFIRWGDGQLYLTGIRNHRIYTLCPEDGCLLEVLAGVGTAGYVDGPADLAKFRTPLGLAVQSTAAGDVLYVGDSGNTAFRQVFPFETADVGDPVVEGGATDIANWLRSEPNPFQETSTIRFELIEESEVRLDVYDVAGRKVRSLGSSRKPAGSNEVVWDGLDGQGGQVESGVYLYRLWVNDRERTKRVVKLP